jgi:hypothetical protein
MVHSAGWSRHAITAGRFLSKVRKSGRSGLSEAGHDVSVEAGGKAVHGTIFVTVVWRCVGMCQIERQSKIDVSTMAYPECHEDASNDCQDDLQELLHVAFSWMGLSRFCFHTIV